MTFSHLKKKKISMVDISKKKLTNRAAIATLSLNFSEKTFTKIINNNSPKGEIFNIARSAGISAAKKTSKLIKKIYLFKYYQRLKLNFRQVLKWKH